MRNIATIVPSCVGQLEAAAAAKVMGQCLYCNKSTGARLICDADQAPRGYQRLILNADPRHFKIKPEFTQ